MTDRQKAGIETKGRKREDRVSDTESRLRKLQGKYDALNSQVDDMLTETMDRSNRFFMAAEIEHLITYQVFNASNDGIWAIDRNRKIIRVNKKLLQLFNKKAENVIGRKCDAFFPEACPLEDACPWNRIRDGGPVVEQEAEITLPSGERVIFRVAFTPLSDLDGTIIGLVETFNDITALKHAEGALRRANRELERQASEDVLTKIANRRHFDSTIQLEWRRQKRSGKPISLIMCDVDFFKNYNDTYGHQAGDVCLVTVASTLQRNIHRGSDLCARYGGEEFVVLLPETDLKGARHVVERIQRKIEEKRIPHERSEAAPYVTVSFGIAAASPRNGSAPEELIRTADRMLYRAKHQGRNCAVAANLEDTDRPE